LRYIITGLKVGATFWERGTMLRAIFAFLWVVIWAIIGIRIAANGKLKVADLPAILLFALLGGILIFWGDNILEAKLEAEGVSLSIKKDINKAKDDAIKEIEEKVNSHEKKIVGLITRADDTEVRLQEAIKMAAPPTLSMYEKRIDKITEGYEIDLVLIPSENKTLGTNLFFAEIIEGQQAKILSFKAIGITQNLQVKINDDGKKAKLQYVTMSPIQRVVLVVSEKCKLSFNGYNITDPIIIDVNGKSE